MFQEWEQIEIEIDGEIDVIYQHRTSNIKTRTDPRISIKTHLEELHVTLTAEMISRINNPTAFTQVCFTHFSTQKLKCTYFSVQPKKGSKLCKVWQLSYLEYALRSLFATRNTREFQNTPNTHSSPFFRHRIICPIWIYRPVVAGIKPKKARSFLLMIWREQHHGHIPVLNNSSSKKR